MKRLLVPLLALSLLTACSSLPPQEFRAGQGSGTVLSATGADLDNVAQPDTADSLEIATSAVPTIPVHATPSVSIVFGTGSVPVLTEFFDYDCEYCREHALKERPWIDTEFLATKKMNIERIFVPFTVWGKKLDTVAYCAVAQNKFKEVDQYLLTEVPRNEVVLNAGLKKIGVNLQTLAACEKQTTINVGPLTLADGMVIDRTPSFRIKETMWKGILTRSQMREKLKEGLKN